jgi:hypothetical protein
VRSSLSASSRRAHHAYQDFYAYDSGASTLRPYANLLGVHVDELRLVLESERGTHDAS